MEIHSVTTNNFFRSPIIDCHAHVGRWYGKNFALEYLDTFTREPLSNGDFVEKILISNLNSIAKQGRLGETDGLEEILSLAKNNPKYAVIAVCQPNLTNGNTETIDKLVAKYRSKIFGLKFHPNSFECSANNSCYENYLKFAQSKHLPCLFHTDSNGLSNVEDIYKLAKKFPNVPVILGHCGGRDDFRKAVDVLRQSVIKKDAKLYCDISWLDWENGLPDGVHKNVKHLIQELKEVGGLDRIMFGTDIPLGCFGENLVENVSSKEAYEKTVFGIKTMIKNNFGADAKNITSKIFYDNADDLFFKKTWVTVGNNSNKILKKISKTKISLALGVGLLTCLGVAYYMLNIRNKLNNSKHTKQKIFIG